MIAAETEVLKLIARVSNFQVRLQVCIHVKGDIKVISCISNEFFFHIPNASRLPIYGVTSHQYRDVLEPKSERGTKTHQVTPPSPPRHWLSCFVQRLKCFEALGVRDITLISALFNTLTSKLVPWGVLCTTCLQNPMKSSPLKQWNALGFTKSLPMSILIWWKMCSFGVIKKRSCP